MTAIFFWLFSFVKIVECIKRELSNIHFIFQLIIFQTIGCDGIVGSEKRPDACGVCGGSNSTCQIVSGIFTEPQLPAGYNLVAQLPKGACHVNITEFKPSRNYLGTFKNSTLSSVCLSGSINSDILAIIMTASRCFVFHADVD